MPIFYQLIIILLLFFKPFDSVIIFVTCYILLYKTYKNISALNPLFWILVSWNILFINAFSGVISYKTNVDFSNPLIFCFFCILLFVIGFYFDHVFRYKYNPNNKKLTLFLSRLGNVQIHQKLSAFFSVLSIIAAILLLIEIVFILGADVLAPALLRETFSSRDATFLSQISSILFFGGLFSLTSLIFFNKTTNKTLFLLGIFSFSMGSILSAGRQMVFQLIVVSILGYSVLRNLKIKIKINKLQKSYFVFSILLIISYFVFISTARSTSGLNDQRSKLELYSSMNNSEYSQGFINLVSKSPPGIKVLIENFLVDYIFYFSHEIYLFSEWWTYNDVEFIDFKFLRFSPFVERQFDRFSIFGISQKDRLENISKEYNKGTIIKQGWPTTNKEILMNVGYIGAFLMIFLHGKFSSKIYKKMLTNPSFGLLNLNIGNNLILFSTISNSAFSETQILFYLIVSFYLASKKI